MQKLDLLGHKLVRKKTDAGGVTTWPGEARDQAKLNRIVYSKDNRNCGSRSFGRECNQVTTRRGNHGHAAPNDVVQQCRHTIVAACQPVILDRDVPALDIT